MKHINTKQAIDWFAKRPGCFLVGLTIMIFLWGCAVAPTKKLTIQDTDQSFEEGEIISTKLGKPVSFNELLADLSGAQIIYIGEKHTNVEHHRIQLKVIQAIFKENSSMAVGMEMFSRERQPVLDGYIQGTLDERSFLKESSYFDDWRMNYHLYKPIIDYVKAHRIPLIALNVEKELTQKVAREGLNGLSDDEKKALPSAMDFSDPRYRARLEEIFSFHASNEKLPEFDFFLPIPGLSDQTSTQYLYKPTPAWKHWH